MIGSNASMRRRVYAVLVVTLLAALSCWLRIRIAMSLTTHANALDILVYFTYDMQSMAHMVYGLRVRDMCDMRTCVIPSTRTRTSMQTCMICIHSGLWALGSPSTVYKYCV